MPDPYTAPAVLPGVFDVAAAIAWASVLPGAPGVPMVPGGIAANIPDGGRDQDRLCIVTSTGGNVAGLDGRELTPRFQFRWRGQQADPLDADRLAWQFDQAVDAAPLPATVAGVRVLSVTWAGGGPASSAAGSGRRPETPCTYLFRIIRPQS